MGVPPPPPGALLINCLHFFDSHKNSSESYESVATVGTKLGVLSPQHYPFILFYYLSLIKKVRIWDKRFRKNVQVRNILVYIFLSKIFLCFRLPQIAQLFLYNQLFLAKFGRNL